MPYERLVALNVSDDKIYTEYRAAMKPLLEQHGGGFRYDFKIAKVLKSESAHEINRVFAIYFKDQENMNLFFSNPEYKKIKEKYFDKSVTGTTEIARYER